MMGIKTRSVKLVRVIDTAPYRLKMIFVNLKCSKVKLPKRAHVID